MIPKFDGDGNAEHWSKNVLEKFDALQLTTIERNAVVPDILTDEALIWYIKHQDYMNKFLSFMTKFIQFYDHKEVDQKKSLRKKWIVKIFFCKI